MANTYVAIATTTVGSGGASDITFSSITGTYTDLLLKISARHTTNETSNDILLTLNGSTSNFTAKRLYGDGSSASSDTNSQRVGITVGASATASTFGSTDAYFPNYAGSTNKSFSSDMVGENNATLAYSILTAGLWSDTSAITSIKIAPASGSFVQHTTATLYGIKNS